MSFSLLRVPAKAALTVWSGLVVGTSCTLVLLTEDRRRRIKQARSAIHNAERIRSSRQYHATVPILDGQSDDTKNQVEVVLIAAKDPQAKTLPGIFLRRKEEYKDWTTPSPAAQVVQTPPGQDQVAKETQDVSTAAAVECTRTEANANLDHGPTGNPDTFLGERMGSTRPPLPPPGPGAYFRRDLMLSLEPLKAAASKPRLPQRSPRAPPLPLGSPIINVGENLRYINMAAQLGDQASLEQAVETLRQTLRKSDLEADDKISLAQAAIKLSSLCQRAGLMDEAVRALHSAVELGPMAEADYYAADPQPIIEYAVSVAEDKIRALKTNRMKDGKRARLLLRKRMDRTIMLLMPMLTEGSLSVPRLVAEWLPAAEKCMHLAFDLENMMNKAADVFWRIQHLGGDLDGRIIVRFMERLHEHGRLSQVVNTFNLLRHKLVNLQADTWYEIGNLVADAVTNAPGQNPAKVLKHMVEFCPYDNCLPLFPLRTTWTTKLLYCHWNRVGKFDETLALFQQFEELGGFNKTVHEDGMYRTMIQIAVEAEQWQELDQLLRKLLAIKPSAAKEARILGLMALAKARNGDWTAVWDDFKHMEIKDRIEDVFGPILHEFINTHTTKETEDFLKAYIQDIDMPISPYMVNMVANRYGAVRDVQSFLDWLAWCSNKGFEIDAAFGNAILLNCRRRWEFSFEELRVIYHTLQALCPSFVDNVTENMMVSKGLTDHRNAKIPFLKKQVGFANRKFYRWTIAESAGDLRVDMRHAFSMRDYKKVLFLYRMAAQHKSMPLDEGHLRLAVQASLKLEKRVQLVLKMIEEAKERNMDVSRAITLVFLMQIRHIFKGGNLDKDQLLREVQDCFERFETSDLPLGHQALLRVAFQLLRAGHFSGAVSFGLSALERKGISYPDDIPTFQLFLVAYGYKADVPGMKWTLAGALHMQYYHKRAVFMALKDTRNFLMKQIQSTDVKKAQRVIEQGLDMVRQRRLHVAEDRKQLQSTAIDIMKRAALDSREQPASEEQIRRRDAMVAELEEKQRCEEEEVARKAEEWKAEMQARKAAAAEALKRNQDEAEVMEKILAAERHHVDGDF